MIRLILAVLLLPAVACAESKDSLASNCEVRIGEGSGVTKGDIGSLRCRVLQVIDSDTCLAKWGDNTFWIRGISTNGIVTDKAYTFSGLYTVTGTKTYQALIGSNTVWTVEPIDVSKEAGDGSRYWVTKDGKQVVYGVYAGTTSATNTVIRIKMSDGKDIKIVKKNLCSEDVTYVDQKLKAAKGKK